MSRYVFEDEETQSPRYVFEDEPPKAAKKQSSTDDTPEWAGRHPNLYGLYGAAKETAKGVIPYTRYLDPADREAFMKKDTQGQTRELLWELAGAELELGLGPIAKGLGAIAGPALERVAPKAYTALTKSRSIGKTKTPAPKEVDEAPQRRYVFEDETPPSTPKPEASKQELRYVFEDDPVEMALLDAQRTPENVLADTVTRQRDIQAGNVPSQGEIVQPVANKSVKVETGVDRGVTKDIPVEEGIRSEQRNMILIDMEQSLKIGKNYGVESRNYGGGWENVNVGSSNPPWLNDLMAAFKKDTKKSVTKEEILATLKKMQDPNSKSLTDKQIDIRYHLDRTIKEMQGQGSFRNEAEAAHLEGRGFVRQQGEIEAYNIDPGDKFIIDGEEFTAKGIDENGNVTLKDGVTRKVSPDETVPFEAIKKTESEGAIDEGFDFGEEPSKSPELPKREPTSTGIKNAVVEAEREAASLGPVKKQEVYGNEAAFEDAKASVEKGEIDPRGLAREVAETPRPITTKEEFALLYDRQRIKGELRVVQKQIDEAQRTGDGIKELELTGKRDRLESDLDFNDKGSTQGGTELGRAMQARTRMIQEDYSLEEILRRARADNGGKPLTPEQRAKYEGLAKRIAEAEDALKKAEAAGKLKDERISQLEAERFVKKVQGEVARENRRVKRAATKEALKEEFDDLVGQLNKALGSSKLREERGSFSLREKANDDPTIAAILGQMARNRIKAGIKSAEELVDHIYTELKKFGYELSKRDIRDVMSNYGKTSKMNQEAIEIELRELRRQMRLISAVEDAKAGKSPLRSGLQRDPVSDEVRKLTRQVKEEMRKSGIDVKKAISPEQQWKTGLDAAKTRLRHLYDDLKKQIETGEKTPQRKPLEYDREATELKKAVDHLRQVLVSIEGRPQLTYPQRVRMAEKAIERSINNLRANILTGAPTTFPKPTPNSPKLTALRKVKEELLKTKKQLADLAKAPKNPDEVAFKSWKTRTKNRIAELEKKAAEGDFSSPARKEAAWRESKEALTYQHNLERAKEAYNQARLKDRLARRTILEKGRDAVIESLNLSRSVITSFDLSAVLRQGGFIVFAHPVRGIKTLPAMFRALSKKGQFAVEQQIKNRPNYKKYKDSGLFLSEHGDVNLRQMEEAYMSRLADKVPGVGASQRAYTTFLNKLRADSFDAMAASLSKNKAATPEEMKAIANYINVATGRGNLWMQENALVGLNTIFFAPRLVASRFNLLAGQPLWRGTARGRIQIAKEYARFLAGVGTVLSLAYMMGAEIETDPRSSDFAKIKIGNTRLDPLAGLAQVITLIARVTTGETKTLSGDYMSLRGEDARYGTGVPNVVGRFLRTKFAPVPGAGMDLLAGEDVVGNEVTPATAAAKAIIPMSFRDIYEAIKDLGLPAGAALSILGLLGMGLNTFEAD